MFPLLFLFFPIIEALPSCLHLRSHCLRNPRCSSHFLSFEKVCGYSLTRCSISSPSDCVKDLRVIQEFLVFNSCTCYKALGFIEECDFFRQLIWNHPCDRLLEDAGQDRALAEKQFVTPLVSPETKRSTRTPGVDKVYQLVQQLNGDLQTKSRLETGTCNEALDHVCMRHVSCRQLWRLFRSSCGVDQDNKCTMTDPEVCWQSFEGLSWTGLGNCHCDTTNSDCHWIRLLTNYNKCIYEISLTKTGTYQQERDRTAEDYRRRFESSYEQQRQETERQERERLERERYQQTNHDRSQHWNQNQHLSGQNQQQRHQESSHHYQPQEPRTSLNSAHNQQSSYRVEQQRTSDASGNQVSRNNQQTQFHVEQQRHSDISGSNRIWQGKPDQDQYQNRNEKQRTGEEYTWNKEDQQRNRVWHVQHDTTSTTSTTTTTTTSTTTTTPKPRIIVTKRPPVRTTPSTGVTVIGKSAGSGLRATVQETPEKWNEESTYYRPLFNNPPTTPPGYYRYTTNPPLQDKRFEVDTTIRTNIRPTQPPRSTAAAPTHPAASSLSTRSPFTRAARAIQLISGQDVDYEDGAAMLGGRFTAPLLLLSTVGVAGVIGSTCPDAVARCEAADECRWHLGELRARCSRSSCRRDECASALERFAVYVPPSHAEPVMFCQCSPGDSSCGRLQELFYPSCLYTSASVLPTCSQTAKKCNSDTRCRALRNRLLSSCPLSNGECVGRSLSDCRRVLLETRGSILEQPCFCPLNDVSCMAEQRMMIPSHPCIEKAMRDLSMTAPQTPITTVIVPRDNSNRENPVLKEDYTKETAEVSAVAAVAAERYQEKQRARQRGRTTTTTSTTTTTTMITPMKGSNRSKHKTTMEPPPPTEAPPPWETTTIETATTTEEYITAAPPPAIGCEAKDASGRNVFFPMGTVMRRYVDWSGRCSSWCECVAVDQLSCERLNCLDAGFCEAPLTSIEFGERIYLKNRGACFCESSHFICEQPEEMPELYPGLYMMAGYSETDVEMLRKEVPSATLEKAGFMSAEPAKDIGSRLQMALERLQPESLQCRLVLLTELSEPGHAFFRVEWLGQNERFNHTKVLWQHDGSEKVCSPPVMRLADLFSNSDSLRYQLVLSTVKQIKVLDYLDGIPASSILPGLLLSLFFLFSQFV